MSEDMRLRVEVEPLSESRVARIRQQVLLAAARERVTAAPRRGRTAMAYASVAVAAVILAFVARAFFTRAHDADDTRLTTNESASQLTVGESSLDIAPRSTVIVHGDDARGIDVVLDRGAVTCEVAPRRGRPPFVVDAGEVRVRVVGTRFTVSREGASAHVAVDHGVVEVASHGVVTVLHDGESWPTASVQSASNNVQSATSDPEDTSSSDAPPGATPPRDHAPRAKPRGHAAKPRASLPFTEYPADEPPPSAPAAPPPPAPAAPPPPPAPSAQALSAREQFESAARLEPSQPARAAAIYRELAQSTTPWAPNALYALARLDADRGNAAEAKRLLQDYLARYPHGQNAQDARELLHRLP